MTEQEMEEYIQTLEPESRELIVRISWVQGSASPIKDRPREPYPVRAKFDEAVDTETGEIIGKGQHNFLKWFVRPGLFRNPFGYNLTKGHIYRLKVRPRGNMADDNEYYVEALLEKDVDEPRLDPIAQFYGDYDTEVTDCIFLNRRKLYGWGVYWDHPRYTVSAVAWIMNPEHGAVEYRPGTFTFLDPLNRSSGKLPFEPLRAYRAQIRKSRKSDHEFLIVRMPVEVKEPRFDAVIEDYLKPRSIKNEFGTFELDRDYDWYEGTVNYGGKEIAVRLDTDDGGVDASVAEQTLKTILSGSDDLIAKAQNYAADEMYDNLEDWYDEPLTREEFIERIGTPEVTISRDGQTSLFFDGGDLFAGHTIIVEMDENRTFTDAYLAG